MLDQLEEVLARHEVDISVTRGISLAVSEAFTNALLHGNKADPGKEVILSLEVNESEVTADIIDQGSGGEERIRGKQPAKPMDEGGRGIDLIRHYAASLKIREHANGGLQVTIVFSRQSKQRVTHT